MTVPGPGATTVTLSRAHLDGAVFDLDGVITDTARVHEAAWKELFDRFLTSNAGPGESPRPFTGDDYRRQVDGKPRYDGVAAFLASRSIELPWGSGDDPVDRLTICGLGNAKDELFHRRLVRQGVTVFDSTVALIDAMRELAMAVAVVSASRNCEAVLAAAGLTDRFAARVDGVDADELGLAGKPDPAIFLEAVGRLGIGPGRAAVFEDSIAGVTAGHRGGFGVVVGVDRHDRSAELRGAGADFVVADLAAVRVTGR